MSDVPDNQVRVTAGQRERVVALLREAAADQRLTFDELGDRLPHAMVALTRGDLHAIVADLVPAAELPGLFAEAPPLSDGPGMTWEHPLLFTGPRWDWAYFSPDVLPPFIELVGGAIRFYCTESRPLAPVIDITYTGSGTLQLIVPEGWGVQVGEVPRPPQRNNTVPLAVGSDLIGLLDTGPTSAPASVDTQVPSRPSPGFPRLVVHGGATTNIAVRNPRPRDLRRLAKQKQRGAIGMGR